LVEHDKKKGMDMSHVEKKCFLKGVENE